MVGILFDLDGTLLDTLDDLTDGVNHTLSEFGYPERTREEIRSFVGNGAARLIALAVPEGTDSLPVLEQFRLYYRDHCRIKTKPYDGIPEALAILGKKYPMAIVSNKPDSAVKPLCMDYFPGIFALGESSGCPRKPSPDMVYQAMQFIGVDRCVYVGDSDVDVLTAKNAGVPCLSVTWGFREENEIGGTHYCADPAEMVSAIERLIAGEGM